MAAAPASDVHPFVYLYQTRAKRWAFTALNNHEFEHNLVVLERWDKEGRYVVCRRVFNRQQAEEQIKLSTGNLQQVSLYVVLDTNNKVVLEVFKNFGGPTDLDLDLDRAQRTNSSRSAARSNSSLAATF